MARHAPNGWLRTLISEAGWTGQALAEAVNAIGSEAGVRISYERSSVAHWLTGTRPPDHVCAFVAEAFTRRLGRTVSVAETGLAQPAARPAVDAGRDPVGQLVDLVTAGRGRRQVLRGLAYSLASCRMPPFEALVCATSVRASVARIGEVGTAQVESAGLMLSLFCEADTAFGAGACAGRCARTWRTTSCSGWMRLAALESAAS